MSEIPGYTLEDYVMWQHDLIVDGDASANVSVNIAVALGNVEEHRLHLTKEQFAKIIAVYEPHREYIEGRLEDFDEEQHGWRQYSSGIHVPDEVFNIVQAYRDLFKHMIKLDKEASTLTDFIESVQVLENSRHKVVQIDFKDRIHPDLELNAAQVDELIRKLTIVRSLL